MKKILVVSVLFLSFAFISFKSEARSTKNSTVGLLGLGNIQLLNTTPEIQIGPGGGMYFDYRFNQRFSLTVEAWASIHNGTGRSNGDNSIMLLGVPTATIKMYFMDDEASKWDPYAGLGIGVYAIGGSNGSNGLGLGGQVALGFDYYFTDTFSTGFEGTFRSAGIITGTSGTNNATAIIDYSLIAKFGYHF